MSFTWKDKDAKEKRNPIKVFVFVVAALVILYVVTMVLPGIVYGIFHMS